MSVASHEGTTLATGLVRPTALRVYGANLYFVQNDPASKSLVAAALPL